MTHIVYLLTGILLLFINGCGDSSNNFSDSYFFSFENDMEGWTARGTDLDNPPIEWFVQRSQEIAKDGNTAAKFYLSNLNDAGKIWIERQFRVKPELLYQVNVRYAFASADWGDINLWTIITGVMQKAPESRDDLIYQGDTGNSSEVDVGYKWLEKSYDFTVQSSSGGEIYIIIGIWGTWETAREYYVDSVRITFTEK